MTMMACLVAILLVSGASAWTEPVMAAPASLADVTAPNDYTLHDEKECTSSGKDKETLFDKYSGGAPTIADCVKRCESMTGCIGFQFHYGKNVFQEDQDFKCTGIAKAPSCTTAANDGDLKVRPGVSFWMRDAGAVAAGSEAVKHQWQGDAPVLTDDNFLPFAGMDCSGGDDGELFAAKTDHTAEQCMVACKAKATCAGFTYNFKDDSETYQRCLGKKQDKCTLVGGREGSVFYADETVYTAGSSTGGSSTGGNSTGGNSTGGSSTGNSTGESTASASGPRGTTSIVVVAVSMLLAAMQL